MLKFKQIRNYIEKNIKQNVSTEDVKLCESLGRFLATKIVSRINVPSKNNSAVDGYAFNFLNYKSSINKTFFVKAEVNAGDKVKKYTSKDMLVKISTGAHLPKRFDTVVMQENIIKNKNGSITLPENIKKNLNVRTLGEDIKKGRQVLKKNHYIRSQDIGILASLGKTKVRVIKQIKVGVMSNGNELIEPGLKKANHQIFDSNRYMLMSLINSKNVKCVDYRIMNDDYLKIKKKLHSISKNCDLIVISGGASSGDKDFIISAVKNLGEIKFWRVGIKPGRPFGLGIINNKTHILILPGNPVASFTIFALFGTTILHKMLSGNINNYKSFHVQANFNMRKKAGREEFLRGRFYKKNNIYYVDKFITQGAGILSSLVWANGLIRIESHIDIIRKGDILEFIPFEFF